MDAVGGLLIILIFIIWGLFKLLGNARRDGIARAERRAYEAKLKSKEYIAEQEERRKKELAYIKETLEKCKANPDINIAIYNQEARQIHIDRLNTFGRSMYSGEMYYLGQRGGIYTISANGTRNYKY
tara:strand:+ start:41 stop:421 length:381 start_codon:yes stop_codon:yes gene_type:complete